MSDEKFELEQERRLKHLEETFNIIDRNGTGYVKSDQLIEFFRNLGMNITQDHIDQIYVSLGFKVDDRIDFYEFCFILETQPSPVSSEKLDITSIYNSFVQPEENNFDWKIYDAAVDYTFLKEVPEEVVSELKSLRDTIGAENISIDDKFKKILMINDRNESIGDVAFRLR